MRDPNYLVRLTSVKPLFFDERLAHSVELLRKAERLALRYDERGFCLAFSGGKDSQALYHVAQMAGVKFFAEYSLTTMDPPELVRFIRRQYPDVECIRPPRTFRQVCEVKNMLPSMLFRFCCAELKETRGAGTVTLTGVRKAESYKRSQRGEAEIVTRRKKDKKTGTWEQLDQFTREKEVEGVQCIKGKDRIVINPIIEWGEDDVWYFLNEVAKVPHCELYDMGYKRLGCLFCPMGSPKTFDRDSERYPKYKAALIRTIDNMLKHGSFKKIREVFGDEITAEFVFQWWRSKKSAEDYKRELEGEKCKT